MRSLRYVFVDVDGVVVVLSTLSRLKYIPITFPCNGCLAGPSVAYSCFFFLSKNEPVTLRRDE